jgi:thiol:disulfide interchange protein/DsbC/DsbD-like thiol-disulfide interchange protein
VLVSSGRALLGAFVISSMSVRAHAQPTSLPATKNRPVALALVSTLRHLGPTTDSVVIALRITPEPGWHTYWRYAGDVGSATRVDWTLPLNVSVSPLRWPTPSLISSPPLASYGYEREVHLAATVLLQNALRAGSELQLRGRVAWVACRVECIAGDVDLSLRFPVRGKEEPDSTVIRATATEATRLQVSAPRWEFAAEGDSNTISLLVDMPPGEQRGGRFFVDTAGVIDHAATQSLTPTRTGFILHFSRSRYSTSLPDRLTGILVVGDSAGPAPQRAIVVDAPFLTEHSAAGPWTWAGLIAAALLGAIGGTLLTLMPCVLPVLSIKAYGFIESAAQDAAAARRHALLFAGGVLASMWILVSVLLGIRAAGVEVGWGYQLQSPAVMGILALVIFSAGLNMAGVFHVPGLANALGGRHTSRNANAFVSGALVTVLATPCSAPFLASAVTYGVTKGWAAAFAVFTAMGIGLAWPVVLVGFFPAFGERLPRAGAWMLTLQRALAFPLFATVVWMAWIVARQSGPNAVAALLSALVVLSLGLWIYEHVATLTAGTRARRTGGSVAAAAAVVSIWLVTSTSSVAPDPARRGDVTTPPATVTEWIAYDPDTLRSLTSAGRTVLLDFTADWCLTCKVNERVAFSAASVQTAIQSHHVVLMRADWTRRDPRVTRALARLGRNSVPLVVVYGPGTVRPEALPALLTPGIVTRALARAAREPAS